MNRPASPRPLLTRLCRLRARGATREPGDASGPTGPGRVPCAEGRPEIAPPGDAGLCEALRAGSCPRGRAAAPRPGLPAGHRATSLPPPARPAPSSRLRLPGAPLAGGEPGLPLEVGVAPSRGWVRLHRSPRKGVRSVSGGAGVWGGGEGESELLQASHCFSKHQPAAAFFRSLLLKQHLGSVHNCTVKRHG